MAKRKSNRAARRLFGMRRWISNRMFFSGEKSFLTYWRIMPSASQNRAKRLVEEARIERHFWMNVNAGMNDNEAYAAAVKTVKGEAQEKAQ
ncbi:hypothetical protein [Serratia nevei]|uniref:hypothetical protein n=1 Tax=Serratia nevei TaxID=2703794 RepID=UPI003FA7209D